MDDHGSSIGKFALFSIYLSEEAEDAARLLRHAVIGPAHVLVVPHSSTMLGLHGRKMHTDIEDMRWKVLGLRSPYAEKSWGGETSGRLPCARTRSPELGLCNLQLLSLTHRSPHRGRPP